MRNIVFVIGMMFSSFSFAGVIDLGSAEDYTVFIKETYTYATGDVQGHSAIGGEVTNTSGQQAYFGQMLDELNVKTPPVAVSSQPAFDSAFAHLSALSQQLASMDDTGTVNKPWSSKLELTANPGTESNDIHYFSFDIVDLLYVTEIAISGVSSGQVVINVSGESIDTSWGGQFINGVQLNYSDSTLDGRESAEILYNFVDAKSIEVDGTLYASILAPDADVIGSNAFTQWGQLIANSWSTGSASQFNYDPLAAPDKTVNAVPEPNLLFVMAIMLVVFIRSNRKPTPIVARRD